LGVIGRLWDPLLPQNYPRLFELGLPPVVAFSAISVLSERGDVTDNNPEGFYLIRSDERWARLRGSGIAQDSCITQIYIAR
jgi:hypothetical protein